MDNTLKYIIGIGASAGGLEAIQGFFKAFPQQADLSFIIVQHLSPIFISKMAEILAPYTAYPIATAEDKMPLSAGHIYLIPAAFTAQVKDQCFVLTPHQHRPFLTPINTLLESLAIAYQDSAIGIILSGTGCDGAVGISAIAEHQGFTLVQNPEEAKYPEMPEAALATQHVHESLPVAEMAETILDYIHTPKNLSQDDNAAKGVDTELYNGLFQLLKQHFKVDFSVYKIGTLARRIHRRMRLLSLEELNDYLVYLKDNQQGLDTLYRDLLIGVTAFFRDPEAFHHLDTEVIPNLFERIKNSKEEIRIWVTPCCTGEEAYSVALLLKRYADRHALEFRVKILATDIHPEFIQKAKKGQYSLAEVASVPKELLDKYFIQANSMVEIVPEIKRKILFFTHNVLLDPPFAKLDLICCRNLLIYIQPKQQAEILGLLRFSLTIGGYLFLGPSEMPARLKPDLIRINPLWKLFKKVNASVRPALSLPMIIPPLSKTLADFSGIGYSWDTVPLFVCDAILNEVISAGFIIDNHHALLHSVGKARKLINFPEGKPVLILTQIIIDELKAPLISTLYEAKLTQKSASAHQIKIPPGIFSEQKVNMTVHPIGYKQDPVAFYWIRFDTESQHAEAWSKEEMTPINKDKTINLLEKELSEAKALLQSSVENMNVINEEMQAGNEELMASNEELQSTNEELLSLNEELNRANLERSQKIADVIEAKNDIDNLIRAADISTIILDAKMEIRLFTPGVKKIFNLIDNDVGRSLESFKHNLKFEKLLYQAQEVLKTQINHEEEIKNELNHWYLLNIVPYRDAQNTTPTGVVLSFTDIHQTKLLQQEKEIIEKDLRAVLKISSIGVWHTDLQQGNFVYDHAIQACLGVADLSSIKQFKDFIAAVHADDRKRIEDAFEKAIKEHDDFEENFRIIRPDGKIRYLSCYANIHHNRHTENDYFTGICWDMTEKYWLAEKIIDAEHLNLGLDTITDGWWDWDIKTDKTFLSPELKKSLGYQDHELSNNMETYQQLMVQEDRVNLQHKTDKYLSDHNDKPMIQEIRFHHKNGSLVYMLARRKGILDKQGKVIRMIGTLTVITSLKEQQIALETLAYGDFLTQASNKPAFLDMVHRALARCKRKNAFCAVLYIDIDDFKRINDEFGHHFGDLVLCELAKRLINISRSIDFPARLGGDEFGVLLEDISDANQALEIAKRYLQTCSSPFNINDIKINLSVSIGIALYPEHGDSDEKILKQADAAMYYAKKHGKNQIALITNSNKSNHHDDAQ